MINITCFWSFGAILDPFWLVLIISDKSWFFAPNHYGQEAICVFEAVFLLNSIAIFGSNSEIVFFEFFSEGVGWDSLPDWKSVWSFLCLEGFRALEGAIGAQSLLPFDHDDDGDGDNDEDGVNDENRLLRSSQWRVRAGCLRRERVTACGHFTCTMSSSWWWYIYYDEVSVCLSVTKNHHFFWEKFFLIFFFLNFFF